MRAKPVIPGAVIRDPDTKRQLPDDGDDVEETSFWIRRFLDAEIWIRRDQAKQAQAVDDNEVSCVIDGELWVRRRAPGEAPAAPSSLAIKAPENAR